MTDAPLRTLVIGFGRIAAGYADDPIMAAHYKYATHAQVLADHPLFVWDAVVDPSPDALDYAKNRWNVPVVVDRVEELPSGYKPDVAIIATPPQDRRAIVEKLLPLKAIMVEKPLGENSAQAEAFSKLCEAEKILVQVNLWRRADKFYRSLLSGGIEAKIGRPQAISGVYGNGLLNNGIHLVDFVRMLFGEVRNAQAIEAPSACSDGCLPGDANVSFSLGLASGITAAFQRVAFEHYREVSLEVWGTNARLAILQEGLGMQLFPRRENRAMSDCFEIASDAGLQLPSTVGDALYHMHTNLAEAVLYGLNLWSPLESALRSTRVIEAILESSRTGQRPIDLSLLDSTG